MSANDDKQDAVMQSRRHFLTRSVSVAALTAAGAAAAPALAHEAKSAHGEDQHARVADIEPFWGTHQGGIATVPQQHTYFVAFDLYEGSKQDVADLMKRWTLAAERMSRGLPAAETNEDRDAVPADSSAALGLPPRRLTLTFGFGPTLFSKDGVDRYGLAHLRPEAFIDLPKFKGDQLVPERTGGDLCVQACSDDPQVNLYAIRHLARLADGQATIRWAQTGFVASYRPGETPRNLMGFKDGTMNVPVDDAAAMGKHVWVGNEGGWMQHGSYQVVRPIRIALEHWDKMKLGFQEQVVGRQKLSGAPLGGKHEKDALNLDAVDADGNPVIPETAHARLSAPESNNGMQILRRGYSYDNGVSMTAERWPPWHQGIEFDAGLLFVCYQRDPRTGFVPIFAKLSAFDMMNQFVTHVGGGLFACPGGVKPGGYIGQALFESV